MAKNAKKKAQNNKILHSPDIFHWILSNNTSEKVYFKSQILVHEYWTILDYFYVPVL